MENYYLIKKQTLQQTADAIREKNGFSDKIDPEDFGFWISNIQGGAGDSTQAYKDYVEGVISAEEMLNMTSTSITAVAPYVFYGNDAITSLSLPECTELGEGSFSCCRNLAEINLPKCTTVDCQALGVGWDQDAGMQTCYRDPETTVINFPKIEYINSKALESLTIADVNDLKNVILLDQVYEVICDNYPNTVELPKVEHFKQGWSEVFSNVINLYMPNCKECCYHEYGTLQSSLIFSKLKVLTLGLEAYPYYQFNSCPVLRELTLTGYVPLYIESFDEGSEPIYGYETNATYVFPSILCNSGVVRVPDDQYDDYLNYSPWNQVHLVPISEKGSLSLLSQCNITENYVKTFVVAHAYGWDFDTLNITYSIDDNSAEIREVFIDKDSHEISIKVFGKTPGFSTVQLTLRDEANEPYVINIDINVKALEGTFSIIDLWHTGEYGFEFEGDNTLISNNSNVHDTTAETRVDFNAPYDGTLYLDWYIESESCCDKGSISTLDTQTYPTEWVFAGNSASGPKTGTVSMEVSPGGHSIYLKYRKDGSASYGIDAFRVTFRFE